MAIDSVYQADFTAKTVARIHVVIPKDEIRSAIPAAIHEISAALKASGITKTGPWFAHHHRQPTDTFDFDVCFPIAEHFLTSGRVETVDIPGTKVIRTIYRGDYSGLPQAWQEISEWQASLDSKTRGDFFEVYIVGPQETGNPNGWETELNCAIINQEA